jgi:hypothetical protein
VLRCPIEQGVEGLPDERDQMTATAQLDADACVRQSSQRLLRSSLPGASHKENRSDGFVFCDFTTSHIKLGIGVTLDFPDDAAHLLEARRATLAKRRPTRTAEAP